MDRNVTKNIFNFAEYKEDEALMKKLVFFLAHDFQHNICEENVFGNKVLDPVAFAKAVGLKNYRSLLNQHPKPLQLQEKKYQDMSEEELKEEKRRAEHGEIGPLFTSWLDNALYRARYDAMKFSEGGKTFDGFTTSKLKELRFLSHVEKFYHSGRKKIYYEFNYDKTFINNLGRFFLKFDFSIYTDLQKPSFQDFYISLINLRYDRNQNNEPTVRVETEFDQLCELAKTECKSPSDNKKHINKAIKAINAAHGFEFVRIKWERNGNFNFKPVLTFTLSDKEIAEQKKDSYVRLDHYVLYNLKNKFRDTFPLVKEENEFKMKFKKWLIEPDNLFDVKHAVFMQTHLQIFGKEVKDPWSPQVMEYIKTRLPELSEKAFSFV
jgi:hypothetical protein